MMPIPGLMPRIRPVVFTDTIPGAPVDQVPPVAALDNVVAVPTQTCELPVIAGTTGIALTVT